MSYLRARMLDAKANHSHTVSNSIATLHHGAITIDSSGVPGEGSTFTVLLPVFTGATPSDTKYVDVEEGLQDNAFRSRSSLKQRRVSLSPPMTESSQVPLQTMQLFRLPCCLIVDDAPTNRRMLSHLLKSIFEQIYFAENGKVAVDFVDKSIKEGTDISAIFMDSNMPVMAGPVATKQIRDMGYCGLVLGVTGNVLDEQIDDFISSGANRVLPKPVNMKTLNTILLGTFAALIHHHMP